jgi:hypothetical protein
MNRTSDGTMSILMNITVGLGFAAMLALMVFWIFEYKFKKR